MHVQVVVFGGVLLQTYERIHDNRRQDCQHRLAADLNGAGVLGIVTKLWPRGCQQEGSGDWYIHAAIL